jgi:uncharacterized protein DUF6882
VKKTTKAKKVKNAKPIKRTKSVQKRGAQKRSVQKRDLDDLSPEADKWLAAAVSEFNTKQDVLKAEWGFDSFERWAYDQITKVFTLQFADGSQFEADGMILGTYCPGDGSWEWAWNNPNVEAHLAVPKETLVGLGKRLNISYLTIGMIPAPTRQLATYLCAIGVKATGASGVYLGGEGPVEAAIVLSNPRRQLKAA